MNKISNKTLIVVVFIMVLAYNIQLQIKLNRIMKSVSNAEYEARMAKNNAEDAASYASDAADYAREASEYAQEAANKAFGNECWSCP
ncbi:alanine-zipper protein [Flagellimonas flava]|uniref:Uncharacterized protein n=1 Tax=Flagellimonas flava TaxID=570519 RepID=A0A1M5NJ38_9FLAO|nr:alanine-zipper protein [Allomuricauda flava]SHG89604.1 hypothetical protein SAMN04488116_2831 [Allomuricauda flava]